MNLFERLAQLNQLFQHSPVEAAYLSGSLASRASFGEMSDVDIAILLTEQISTDRFLDFQLFFLSELSRRLESDALDVVILNQASLLLKLQVIKYGQILYSRDERKRLAFETRAVMQYLDFRQMDELQNHALSRRLRAPSVALDRDTLRSVLDRLAQAMRQTAALSGGGDDSVQQAAFERYALLTIEAAAELAALVCAGLRLGLPEAYAEVLKPLVKRNLIGADLALAIEPLLDQRDDLMRQPERLDHATLTSQVAMALPALHAFAAAIEHLIDHLPTLTATDKG